MTPNDLLKHFGTQAAVARYFGISAPSVHAWFVANTVPQGRQYEAQMRTGGALLASPAGPDNPPSEKGK